MSQNIDLKALEKKAWRSVFQDGLWDIYLGIILISFAVSAGLDKLSIDDDLRMGSYISVMVFGMIVLYVGKRFITIPRMGTVKFGAERQKRRNIVRLVLFVSVLLGLLMWWLSSSLLVDGKWVMPLVWMLNMFLVFGLGAYFLEYERLYLIGLLYALVLPVDMIVKAITKMDMDVYIFSTAGLIILVMGIAYLVRFMSDYKPLDLNQG